MPPEATEDGARWRGSHERVRRLITMEGKHGSPTRPSIVEEEAIMVCKLEAEELRPLI